jgi:carbon-monoxide dehydrogenase medium subunit
VLVEIEVPAPPPRTGAAFVEFARRHGDFALAGAAAVVTLSETGVCERAAVVLLAAGPTPVRATAAEEWLPGVALDERTAAEAAARATADIRPASDVHGSTEFRRALADVMVRRALLLATQRAPGAPA